jgi:hypothetical protein
MELYYSFQAGPSGSRALPEQCGRADRDGVIVGCNWVTGRWAGKDGLEFKRVSDRVRFHVPGQFRSLSLLAWVRVDALPHRFNSLMMTDGWDTGEPHWHISNAGRIALGVQGGKGKGGFNYVTAKVFTPERLGQWAHLAVVYNGEEGLVSHYIDGRLVAEEPTRFDILLCIGDAELGNWNLGTRRREKRPIRYFSGCIDEFMLLSRPVSEQEIGQLHAQGRLPL